MPSIGNALVKTWEGIDANGPVSQTNAYYGLRRVYYGLLSKKGEVYPKRRPESPFSKTATIAILACVASISRNW